MKHLGTRVLLQCIGLFVLGSAAGCQAIIGTESRDVDPLVGGCTFPTNGDAKVRFVSLVPNDALVDVCIRPSGGDYGRPVLRGGGSACATGFKYAEMTAPFAVQSGKIDVKIVAGGQTCKATALSETTNIDVPSGSQTTLLRMGNAKTPETIKWLRETTTRAASGNTKLRLIHASPGTPALDWGLSDSPRLPTDISKQFLLAPLSYGESTTKDSKTALGKADENGYVEFLGTKINMAAAPTGQKRALLAFDYPGTEAAKTIIAIGDPTLPFFPVRALICTDSDVTGLKTNCTQSPLGTLSIDAFNAYLYGPFAPNETERWPYVRDAIIGRTDGEVMCITAMSRRWQQDEVVAKGKEKGTWPYSYQSNTNLDTKATDPADPKGNIPPPYTTPPCGGANDAAQVEAALSCIETHCKDAEGKFKGDSSCLSGNCSSQLIPFIVGNKDENRCFNCMTVASLSDSNSAEVRDLCQKDIRDYKAFNGVTDSFVLSKFPIQNAETYILPSTSYQRVVHYGQIEIEKGKLVDFYCGELSAAFGDLVPYYGYYADPDRVAKGEDRWELEQEWQANLVRKFVQKKSGDRSAIITGEWAASREYKTSDGKILIDEQSSQVLDALEMKSPTGAPILIPALPKDFVPFCTECQSSENPYNGDKNVWQFHTYVYNMPATSGVEVGKFFTDAVVPIGDKKFPISDRWGFNTRILRP